MKRPKNTGGGLPLLALEEALGHEGCAVRGLVEQSGHGYLKTLLYEMVNDPGVQSAFRSSAGPCGRRAYRMLDLGDGLVGEPYVVGVDLLANDLPHYMIRA